MLPSVCQDTVSILNCWCCDNFLLVRSPGSFCRDIDNNEITMLPSGVFGSLSNLLYLLVDAFIFVPLCKPAVWIYSGLPSCNLAVTHTKLIYLRIPWIVDVVIIFSMFTHGVFFSGTSVIMQSLCCHRVFSAACRICRLCETMHFLLCRYAYRLCDFLVVFHLASSPLMLW